MDKVDEVKPRGRPRKEDPATPLGEYQVEQARLAREKKNANPVVETFYEMAGNKLILCKRRKTGTVYKTFVGTTLAHDKMTAKEKEDVVKTKIFAEKLQKEGKLRIKL